MTISSINSQSYLYGASQSSAAAQAFQQFAPSGDSGTVAAPPPPPRGQDMEAAKAKLKQIDPQLAEKMEQFHQKMDDLVESGASQDTIQQTMKSQMDSLSDQEKSELDSVFGKPGAEGGGEVHLMRRGDGGGLAADLASTDPALSEKLKGFQDAIKQLKDSGASEDTIRQTMKSQMDSLSDDEQSEIQTAMQVHRAKHQAQAYVSAGDSSSTLAVAA